MSTENSTLGQGYRQLSTGGDRIVGTLARYERVVWAVLLSALLADVVLTYHGLQSGFTEGNPAMRIAIDSAGIFALVGAKLLVVGVGAVVRGFLGENGVVVPLGLALPWAAAAVINATLLL